MRYCDDARVTQLLTVITRNVIVQVADTRTSRRLPGGRYEPVDDLTQKPIVIDGRAVLAFTGPTQALRQSTHEWALDAMGDPNLGEGELPPVERRLELLRDGATRQLSHFATPPLLTFAGGAWVRTGGRDRLTAVAVRVTNAGLRGADPERSFKSTAERLKDVAMLMVDGQPLSLDGQEAAEIERDLLRRIRVAAATTTATARIVELLVSAMRRVAAANGLIGPNVLVTSLPRGVYLPPSFVYLTGGPNDWSRPQFQYMPGDGASMVRIGPSFVFGNILGRDVVIAPSAESLT